MKKICVLHIGNTANNAYLNAKFLRKKGIKSDVLHYGDFYIMSSPEWEEANCEGDHGDDFYPDWSKVDLEGFELPEWFFRDYLVNLDPDRPKLSTEKTVSPNPGIGMKPALRNFILNQPQLAKQLAQGLFFLEFVYRYLYFLSNKLFKFNLTELAIQEKEMTHYRQLIKEFRVFFPNRKDKLTLKDILHFQDRKRIFQKIFKKYNLIQGYSTDPMWPLLTGFHPYTAYEHGTIREIPFENNAVGRLTALAYKKADAVFITNADNILAAKKLNLTNFVGIPHPIQDIWHKKWQKKQKKHKEIVIFFPSRHDWKIKGNDIAIKGIAQALKKTIKTIKIYFIEWGLEVGKSKALIRKLGFEQNTVWLKPISRKMIGFWMEQSDIVMDQFVLQSMGGIATEAMLSGKPVLLSYNHRINQWLFPEKPPLVCVSTQKEIAHALLELIKKPALRRKLGQQGKDWFYRYHSEEKVVAILLKSFDDIDQ